MNLTSGVLIFLLVTSLHAQSPNTKFEAGVGYSLIRTNFLDRSDKTGSGIATRVGYSFYDSLAVEAELNMFPRDLGVFSKGMIEELFGPKVGWRSENVGIFGKVRPGFIHFRRQREPFPCIAVFPPPLVCVLGGKTEFALDAGGVVEFYPRPRITLRLDAGDAMIRFPGPYHLRPDGFWSHNFQFSTGIGFRF